MENASLSLGPIMWLIFGAMILLTASVGAVLAYHWFRYAMNAGATSTALAAYAIVCGVLLSGMFATLLISGAPL